MLFKSLVILLTCCLAAQALNDEVKAKLKEVGKMCAESSGLSRDVIMKLRSGDYTSNDPLISKFEFCILKKFGIMSETGVYSKEAALKYADDSEKQGVSDAIDKCIEKIGKVTENNLWDFCKCYHTFYPDHMLV